MNNEYIKRVSYANEINEKVFPLGIDIILIGSVAYNPDAVLETSDLDLLGVCDFAKIDFPQLFKSLDVAYDKNVMEYAKSKTINNVSLVWVTNGFETGLHLWDISAFNNVCNFTGLNYTFRSDQQDGAATLLKARSDKQVFKSLSGIEKEVDKLPLKVVGGTVLTFFSYFEDENEFYPNIQIYNLLLSPVILSKNEDYLKSGIETMERIFKEKLVDKYGTIQNRELSLIVPLPEKIRTKLPGSLIEKLDNYLL